MKDFLKINKIENISIVKYLLTVIYPNYIILFYTLKDFKKINITFFNKIGLLSIINQNRHLFNIILISSIFIVPFLSFIFIKNKQENKLMLTRNVLKVVLSSISQVLEIKRKRFLDFYNHISKKEEINNIDKENIFETITQPIEQIIKIFDAIKYSFSKICKEDDIKVSIIRCENNKMVNYVYQSDDKPNTSIQELNDNKSTAKQVILRKKMIVIENTDKKTFIKNKKWFYKGENDISQIKSILCYPVRSGKNIIYLITLTSKESKTFKNKYSSIYEYMLSEFSSRILLETYLLNIKKIVSHE